MIQVGKRGRIVRGEQEGWYILIQDDTANTGGYYVLTSSTLDFKGGLDEGYDDWIESKETLPLLFKERGWEVEWEA